MTEGPVRVGPFVLEGELSRGATAVVWSGHHGPSGAPVAVKVISPPRKTKVPLHRLFAREVRALASLTHPGIVTIHDHGRVDDAATRASGGALPSGAPYLVMERATHGTLRTLLEGQAAPNFASARSVLLSVLDALAHAHARGVIHRDVKPANILTTVWRGERTVKLTDFGIAQALSDAAGWKPQMVGTPAYMAPEQIRAEPRRQGPWTDLYAVGCLAQRLVTGTTPFGGRGDVAAILGAHLTSQPPRLVPRMDVPEGLAEWIARLLEKPPGGRYRRCADAAVDLLALGEPGPSEALWEDRTVERMSQPFLFTIAAETHTSETDILADLPRSDVISTSQRRLPAARVPASWRPVDEPESEPMASVGLGLYGVRTIPVVGRERERDALWEQLRQTSQSRRPRFVALSGPAGAGKSRLARWLTERAHEVGAATVLRASHGVSADASHGWVPMLAREVGVSGLTGRAEIREQLQDHLEGLPSADDEELLGAIASMFELRDVRSSAVEDDIRPYNRRLLAILAEERPLVVWLDDVQWGLDSLVFVHDVMTHEDELPVLFVATSRSDLMGERATEENLMHRLMSLPSASRVDVPPLGPDEHAQLVRWLLGLDRRLADLVSERTQGLPLFAVQLVGDLVSRGVLEPGPDGFRMREGAKLTLPDDIHEVWVQRVERLRERYGDDARRALEVAAALGDDIALTEWEAACLDLSIGIEGGLLERMLDTRLAVATHDGWSFAHGTLRESLERLARPSGRWAAAHLACARAISRIYLDRAPHSERIALHCLSGGRLESALEPLLSAIERRMKHAHLDLALELLDKLDATLDALRADPDDARRLRGMLLRGRIHRVRSEVELSAQLLSEVERRQGPTPELLLERASLEWLERSNRQLAQRLASSAAEGFAQAGDAAGEAEARLRLAGILIDRGVVDASLIGHVSHARHHFESVGDPVGLARCEVLLGQIAMVNRDFARAIEHGEAAGEALLGAGALDRYAFAKMLVGECERYRRSWDAAVAAYHRAERVFGQLGSVRVALARYNRCLVEIHRERFDEAEHLLREIEAGRLPHPARMRANLAYAWMPVEAAAGRWQSFDCHLEEAVRWTPAQGRTSMDFALLAHQAAQLAARRRERGRAAAALDLAEQHYRALGMVDEADSVARAVLELRGGGAR